ncbi:UNVERIFIED_CONTAM: hypothetical protein FKN15_056607 [Acipenser sinensis]
MGNGFLRMTVLIPWWAGPSASSQEGAYRQLWYTELSDTYPMGRHIPNILFVGGRLLFQGSRVTVEISCEKQIQVILMYDAVSGLRI